MPNDRFLTAYVDLPFLKKLFRDKPEDLSMAPDDDWPVVWQNVYRFLQLSAKIVVGTEEQVIEEHDAVARFLFGGGFYRHIDFQPRMSKRYVDPESIEIDDHPHSVFLLEGGEIQTTALRKRTGLLFLDFEDLTVHWPRVLKGHNLNILPKDRLPGRRRPFEWNDLQVHASPLNALVIADKYAYEQFKLEDFERNLGKLLLTLLPDELDHPIHITLVTDLKKSLKKDFDPNTGKWPHPKDIYKKIQKHLRENFPKLDFHLGVVGYSDDGHKDRFIFTNYGLFTSNDSFSFFDENDDEDGLKLTKETLVTYLPSSTQGPEVVKPRLKRMAKYLRTPDSLDASIYSLGPDDTIPLAYGDDRNRLLNIVE